MDSGTLARKSNHASTGQRWTKARGLTEVEQEVLGVSLLRADVVGSLKGVPDHEHGPDGLTHLTKKTGQLRPTMS